MSAAIGYDGSVSLRRLSRPRWLVAAGVTAGLGVLVTGALASSSAPTTRAALEVAAAARVTLELVPVTRAECAPPRVLLGGACLDKSEMIIPDKWTIGERSAQWAPEPPQAAGRWRTNYAWTVPQTIPPAGATLTLKLTAAELTKNPNARICPQMGVRSALTGSVDLSVCAPSGGTASDSKTVRLVPDTSPPGTSIYLSIGLQDGPGYTYKYRAAKQTPKCKAPPRLPASAGEDGGCVATVVFSFTQSRTPFRFGKDTSLPDRVTSAGSGSFSFKVPGDAYAGCSGRVQATIAHAHERLEAGRPRPRIEKTVVRLGGRERPSAGCAEVRFHDEKPLNAFVQLKVQVTGSTDPRCAVGRLGTVDVRDGRPFDFVVFNVCGHRHVYAPQAGSGKRPEHRLVVRMRITSKSS